MEINELKRIYVCHPFSGDPKGNAEKIRLICREIVAEGHFPVAPQLYLPNFMREETERERAMQFCTSLLTWCDEVYVYGSERTAGMVEEIDTARWFGIPLTFVGKTLEGPRPETKRQLELTWADDW